MKKNGFEIVIWDFCPFLQPLRYKKETIREKFEGKERIIFATEKEALKSISELREGSFVMLMMACYKERIKIYRALSKTGIPYAVEVLDAVPVEKLENTKTKIFFKKASKITLSRVIKAIPGKVVKFSFFRNCMGIREPKFLLAGGTMSPQVGSSSNIIGKNTEILWLHANDYNIYLESFGKVSSINNDAIDTATYIDIGIPKFLRDELSEGKTKSVLTEERYYPSLCNFFNNLEDKFKVKVQIAAHPGADHELYPDYFGKRKTLHGQTFQMIKESKIVITHASTAMNFAVLCKKPVIFITSDEVKNDYNFHYSIEIAASWIGKKPINIDSSLEAVDWHKELTINDALYDKFKNNFIKKDGTEELNSWQTGADKLKTCN